MQDKRKNLKYHNRNDIEDITTDFSENNLKIFVVFYANEFDNFDELEIEEKIKIYLSSPWRRK